jgi:hypothetical protein
MSDDGCVVVHVKLMDSRAHSLRGKSKSVFMSFASQSNYLLLMSQQQQQPIRLSQVTPALLSGLSDDQCRQLVNQLSVAPFCSVLLLTFSRMFVRLAPLRHRTPCVNCSSEPAAIFNAVARDLASNSPR